MNKIIHNIPQSTYKYSNYVCIHVAVMLLETIFAVYWRQFMQKTLKEFSHAELKRAYLVFLEKCT